jgi:hypothetical protein
MTVRSVIRRQMNREQKKRPDDIDSDSILILQSIVREFSSNQRRVVVDEETSTSVSLDGTVVVSSFQQTQCTAADHIGESSKSKHKQQCNCAEKDENN